MGVRNPLEEQRLLGTENIRVSDGVWGDSRQAAYTSLADVLGMRKTYKMALIDPIRDPFGTIRKQPPSFFRRLAWGWTVIGALVLILASAMAVGHYGYGVPIYDKATGQLIDPTEAATILIVLGLGGFFFAVAGVLILHVLRKTKPDGGQPPG